MARVEADDNVRALLDAIAWAEIGPEMLADLRTDDGYCVLVGSLPGALKLFDDYSDHPLIDKPALEYTPGLYSSAAGRYQILSRYWRHYQQQLGLPDFGPESQDRYAIQQLREQGALEPIGRGDLQTAIERCGNIWASLGHNDYEQPTHRYEVIEQAFVNAGGIVWDSEALNKRIR